MGSWQVFWVNAIPNFIKIHKPILCSSSFIVEESFGREGDSIHLQTTSQERPGSVEWTGCTASGNLEWRRRTPEGGERKSSADEGGASSSKALRLTGLPLEGGFLTQLYSCFCSVRAWAAAERGHQPHVPVPPASELVSMSQTPANSQVRATAAARTTPLRTPLRPAPIPRLLPTQPLPNSPLSLRSPDHFLWFRSLASSVSRGRARGL